MKVLYHKHSCYILLCYDYFMKKDPHVRRPARGKRSGANVGGLVLAITDSSRLPEWSSIYKISYAQGAYSSNFGKAFPSVLFGGFLDADNAVRSRFVNFWLSEFGSSEMVDPDTRRKIRCPCE